MFFCREAKFVYWDCARCGSTSVMTHLAKKHYLERYGKRRHLLKCPPEMRSWKSFTVVRHPYQRVVSFFWMRLMNGKAKNFEEWIEAVDAFKYSQLRYSDRADHTIKLEEIDKAGDILPFWPEGEFPHRHKSDRETFTISGRRFEEIPDNFLTKERKALIARKFKEDFKRLGYKI